MAMVETTGRKTNINKDGAFAWRTRPRDQVPLAGTFGSRQQLPVPDLRLTRRVLLACTEYVVTRRLKPLTSIAAGPRGQSFPFIPINGAFFHRYHETS